MVGLLACSSEQIRSVAESAVDWNAEGLPADVPHLTAPVESSALWALDDVPEVVVGRGPDINELLYGVDGGWIFDDGSFVITNRGTMELRFYSSSGELTRVAGRMGSGPDEFARFENLMVSRDSIFVFDRLNARVAVVTRAGLIVRHIRVDAPDVFLGVADSGTILVGKELPAAVTGGRQSAMSAYRVVGYSGETRSLGSFFVTETYWVGIDDGFEEVGQPLRRTSATVVSGNEWFYAPGGEYVVVRYDAEGRATRVYRHPDRPPPIAPADLEAYLDDYFGARARAGRLERLMREAPLRERLPGYNRVRVDPLGNLWAHPYPSATAPDCWHVYEIDGGGFARLCVPEEAEILGVGQEYVLVVRTGELGVETVERYRISR